MDVLGAYTPPVMGASSLSSAAAKLPSTKGASNEKAAKEMEALFVSQLMKAMRQTVPKDGLMGGGKGEDVARTLQDEAIGKAMAERGGLGLAEQLLHSLNRINPQGLNLNNPEQSAGPNGTD